MHVTEPDPGFLEGSPGLASCHSIPCRHQVALVTGRAESRVSLAPVRIPADQTVGSPNRQLSTGDLALLALVSIALGVAAGCLTRSTGAPVAAAWLAGVPTAVMIGSFLLAIRDRMVR
jgi:hypothetical protein